MTLFGFGLPGPILDEGRPIPTIYATAARVDALEREIAQIKAALPGIPGIEGLEERIDVLEGQLAQVRTDLDTLAMGSPFVNEEQVAALLAPTTALAQNNQAALQALAQGQTGQAEDINDLAEDLARQTSRIDALAGREDKVLSPEEVVAIVAGAGFVTAEQYNNLAAAVNNKYDRVPSLALVYDQGRPSIYFTGDVLAIGHPTRPLFISRGKVNFNFHHLEAIQSINGVHMDNYLTTGDLAPLSEQVGANTVGIQNNQADIAALSETVRTRIVPRVHNNEANIGILQQDVAGLNTAILENQARIDDLDRRIGANTAGIQDNRAMIDTLQQNKLDRVPGLALVYDQGRPSIYADLLAIGPSARPIFISRGMVNFNFYHLTNVQSINGIPMGGLGQLFVPGHAAPEAPMGQYFRVVRDQMASMQAASQALRSDLANFKSSRDDLIQSIIDFYGGISADTRMRANEAEFDALMNGGLSSLTIPAQVVGGVVTHPEMTFNGSHRYEGMTNSHGLSEGAAMNMGSSSGNVFSTGQDGPLGW